MASLKPWIFHEKAPLLPGGRNTKNTTVEVGNHHDNLAKVINRPMLLDSGCVT